MTITGSNNWGVPDWRDEAAYPRLNDLDETHWRWEFLRRRDDVRKDWEVYANDTFVENVSRSKVASDTLYEQHIWSLDAPKFRAKVPNCLHKYCLDGLPNPSLASPSGLKFQPSSYGLFISYSDEETMPDSFLEDSEQEEVENERLAYQFPDESHKSAPSTNGVEWNFDLSKPLSPQFNDARKYIDALCKELTIPKKRDKPTQQNLTMLLRVIDARQDDQTLETIGREVLGISEGASHGTNVAANAKTKFEAAYDLGINFSSKILLKT